MRGARRERRVLMVVGGDLVERDGRILLLRWEEAARFWIASARETLATSMTLDQCWTTSEI